MLFRSHNKQPRPFTFHQELRQLKNPESIISNNQKSDQNYQLTLKVLDLLADRSPQLTQELLIVKQSLTKWYEHIRQQKLQKARQIYDMREKMMVRIKKQAGIVLEQIAYYLRSVMEEYKDENIERYYVQYLNALKKLQWGVQNKEAKIKTVNQQVQTLIEQHHMSMNSATKMYDKTSLQTIQSPTKKYKDVEYHKYLETRQENIQLQKQCNGLNRQIANLQLQLQRLKQELSRTLRQNSLLKQNEKNYLEEVGQLSKLLDKIKEEAQEKQHKQRQAHITLQMTKQKYQHFDDFKDTIYKELDQAEQQIKQKQRQSNQKKAEEFFNQNYYSIHDELSESQPSSQIHQNHKQNSQISNQYRMLMLQALSLQDFLEASQKGPKYGVLPQE